MIVGLIKPNEGNIFVDEKEITGMPMYKRAQLGIGYLPQGSLYFSQIKRGRQHQRRTENDKISKLEAKKAWKLLDEFGLQENRRKKVWGITTFPGGKRPATRELAKGLRL